MDNTKEQLIQTAYQLIRKSGYDSFSYQDLAQTVGIKKASIHYHFPAKEDMGLAVCGYVSERLSALSAALAATEGVRENMELYLAIVLPELRSGLICPISSMHAEFNVIPAAMREAVKSLTGAEVSILEKILEQGRSEGIYAFPGSARAQAVALIGVVKGAAQYARVMEEELADDAVRQFFNQMEGKTAASQPSRNKQQKMERE